MALFNVLNRAQQEYIYPLPLPFSTPPKGQGAGIGDRDKYRVDICSIVSTSSLALKIFRKKSQDVDIPVLNNNIDSFIRKAYFGGATDYYTCTSPIGRKS